MTTTTPVPNPAGATVAQVGAAAQADLEDVHREDPKHPQKGPCGRLDVF
jgi:hypothetical protein